MILWLRRIDRDVRTEDRVLDTASQRSVKLDTGIRDDPATLASTKPLSSRAGGWPAIVFRLVWLWPSRLRDRVNERVTEAHEDADKQIDFRRNRFRFLAKILTVLTLLELSKSFRRTSDRE